MVETDPYVGLDQIQIYQIKVPFGDGKNTWVRHSSDGHGKGEGDRLGRMSPRTREYFMGTKMNYK